LARKALAAYFNKPCDTTLDEVRGKFESWRDKKKGEYKNPDRNKTGYITELENYLGLTPVI
jgi:hypothetical protein